MINLLHGIAGFLSLGISIFGITFLVYQAFKRGLKGTALIALFILICVSSYLVTEPNRIIEIGKIIFNSVIALVKGGL
jgi:hypothetical protein